MSLGPSPDIRYPTMHAPAAALPTVSQSALSRLFDNRNFLGLLFMLPAAVLLVLFLTYPLGLGVWLGFTDAKVGRPGEWIGSENYEYLVTDSVFRLSVWNTFLYTVIASAIKFALGLWLALLLNEHLPFKAFVRAIVLLPFIVPTVLSAIAFWWIYDAQFSIISWTLTRLGLIDTYIDFLGEPNMARGSVIAASSHIRIAPAWCGIIERKNCRSPTAVWRRIRNQNKTVSATPVTTSARLNWGFGYIEPIVTSIMISMGAAISPVM